MAELRRELLRVLALFLVFQGSCGIYLYVRPNVVSPFSYDELTGPEKWCGLPGNEQCCPRKYSRQSPININTKYLAPLYTRLSFDGYKTSPTAMEITNNGHTVILGFTTQMDKIPSIAGGPLAVSNVYYLDTVHFHWGPNSTSGGAEHLINDLRYPMEMHFVHRNAKYANSSEAQKNFDGLAVMAVFVSYSKYDNPNFSDLVRNLQYIRYKSNTKDITSMALGNILPPDPATFFAYPGSLTTPPCSEAVSWIVFNDPVTMSKSQMSEFRKLQENTKKDSKGNNPILKNFRPVQPLNDRTVYLWADGKPVWGG